MKQNWMQLVTLLLCLVLLVLLVSQNRAMEERQAQLENQIHDLHMMLSDEVRSLSRSVARELEEAGRLVADYALEPKGISAEQKALLADVSVSLKEWYDDTAVTLLATVGEASFPLPMVCSSSGLFTAELSIPLGETCEISLSAQIAGGGKTHQEELGGWSDISLLLPLRNTGSGWDGPNYLDGSLSSNFSIFLEGRSGELGPVRNPHFQVYRNGELVQTIPAVIDPYSSGVDSVAYTVDTPGNRWHLACEIGDAIDLRFRCEDEYGLGYDFLFGNWTAHDNGSVYQSGTQFQSGNSALNLYWPE